MQVPITLSTWYKAAVEKFTWKQNQDLERRWDYFEYVLRQNQRKSAWGTKLGLSEDTLNTIKEMYKHLEYRVAIAEDSLVAADGEIERLTLDLRNKAREIGMHQDLKGELSEFKKFAEVNGFGQVMCPPPELPPTPGSEDESDKLAIVELESQLAHALRVKDDLDMELIDLQHELEDARSKIAQLEQEVEAADSKAKSTSWKNDELEAELVSLQRKLEDEKCKTAQIEQEAEDALSQACKNNNSELEDADKMLAESTRQAEAAEIGRKQEVQQWLETKTELEARIAEQQMEYDTMLRKHSELQKQFENAIKQYQRSQDNARMLFDQVQDLKGNLRVMCRIRPQLIAQDHELEKLDTNEGTMSDHLQVISMAKRNARNRNELDEYEMERVFEKDELNEQIFDEVGQLVGSAINGRNVCIFAYGQTGSGKTHTMNYPWNEKVMPDGDVDMGIIPRSVDLISLQMKERRGIWRYTVTGKYIEIYAEKVFDLLRDNAKNAPEVPVKFGKENRNGKVQDFFEAESTVVDLTEQGEFEDGMKQMLTKAAGNRRVRATTGNAQSSRSHCLLSLRIVGQRTDGKPGKTDGTLNLIDLAGSEKPSTTDKASQKEGIQINRSLTTLRKVLDEMSKNQQRVSFRESTLTKLLQNSLGEGCKTLMFVMISPLSKDREETRNTLEFAMSAQKVKLKAVGKGA